MNLIFRVLLIFTTASAGVAPVCAADEAKPVSITFRTLCFFPVGEYKSLAYQVGKEGSAVVELARYDFSPAYSYQGPPIITFSAPGNPANIAARATIPANVHQALLLFLPAAANSAQPFRLLVLDDSANSLARGDSLFMNFSKQEVAGTLGDRKLQIRPGQSVKMTAPTAKNGRYPVDIRSKTGDTWRPLCKSLWFHDPSTRQLVFIFEEPTSKRTHFMSLSYPLPEAPAGAKPAG